MYRYYTGESNMIGCPYQYLVIEGNIGSGKTSLAQILAQQWNTSLVLEEFADNPFLAKFYESAERYAFPLELSFLSERFSQLKNEINRDLFQPKVIADYFISKCQIFASNNLKDDEWLLFNKMFDIVSNSLPQPEMIVYLYVHTTRLQDNIKKRGRDYEQKISDEYLNNIQSQYLQYFQQHPELTVLMLDTSEIDFIAQPHWIEIIKKHIVQKYNPGIHRITISKTEIV
jgi:deoxyadenosine/deoxycytidine kinase